MVLRLTAVPAPGPADGGDPELSRVALTLVGPRSRRVMRRAEWDGVPGGALAGPLAFVARLPLPGGGGGGGGGGDGGSDAVEGDGGAWVRGLTGRGERIAPFSALRASSSGVP